MGNLLLILMMMRELAGVSPRILTLDRTVHVMRLVLPLMRHQEGGMVHQVVWIIQHVVLRQIIGLFLIIGGLLLSMIDLKFLIKVILNVLDLAVTLALCARVVILLVNTHSELASVRALGYKLAAVGVRDHKHPWVSCGSGCTTKHEEDVRIRHDKLVGVLSLVAIIVHISISLTDPVKRLLLCVFRRLLHHKLVVVGIIILLKVRVLVLLNSHLLLLLLLWGLPHRTKIPVILEHVLIDFHEEIGVWCESHAILLFSLLLNHDGGLLDFLLYGRVDFDCRGRLRVLSELIRLLRALLDCEILVLRP